MEKSKIQKRNLNKILNDLKSVVVAFSGGLDSTFLLKAAMDALGRDNVIAVTARSETYPYSEYKEARELARKIGARHLTIETGELTLKSFKNNPVNRCYYCKKELFKKLDEIRKRYRFGHVLDGTNYDDLKDIRHGRKAAAEFDVRSPLLEAAMTKNEIRKRSKKLKLETWDKPSFACLASRIPFNQTIEKHVLNNVDSAESFLRSLGIKQVRVRAHKEIARIEVSRNDFRKVIKNSIKITNRLKELGFIYTALDLSGYRTGSMHEVM